VPTPATKMRLVEVAYVTPPDVDPGDESFITSDLSPFPKDDDVRGAEIRLRYRAASDHRDTAHARAKRLSDRWLAAGAAEVKLEFVPAPTTRARAPEVAAAPTLADKLRAVWATQGEGAPDDVRAARLLARVEVIS